MTTARKMTLRPTTRAMRPPFLHHLSHIDHHHTMHAPTHGDTDDKYHHHPYPCDNDDTYAATAAARWHRQGVLSRQPPQHTCACDGDDCHGHDYFTSTLSCRRLSSVHPLSRQSPPHHAARMQAMTMMVMRAVTMTTLPPSSRVDHHYSTHACTHDDDDK